MNTISSGFTGVGKIITLPFQRAYSFLNAKIPQIYFGSYKDFSEEETLKKTEEIFQGCNREVFDCKNDEGKSLDVQYLTSEKEFRMESAVVICSPISYLEFSARYWNQFLGAGADVVLWNPTKEITPISYSEDLSCLLKKMRKENEGLVISVKTHCATSDPAIMSVADLNEKNIHLIVDRGYGDAYRLARSYTPFAKLPFVRSMIKKHADCFGREKIKKISGEIIFIHTPGSDQVMDYGIFSGGNLTKDLEKQQPSAKIVEMEKERDHWASWSPEVYETVFSHLEKVGAVSEKREPIKGDEIPNIIHGERWKSAISKFVKKLSFYP